MDNNRITIFPTIAFRPHPLQYVINELPGIGLMLTALWVYEFCDFKWHEYFIFVSLFLAILLLYRFVSILRTEYVITSEQLIVLQGVFSYSTNYVELYRVVDYRQHRSLPQQLLGLKTVSIFSGDRNNQVVKMIGIKADKDVVSEIRMRVEFNKKRKGIYEITNRL